MTSLRYGKTKNDAIAMLIELAAVFNALDEASDVMDIIESLDSYNLLREAWVRLYQRLDREKAFESSWPTGGVRLFAISMGLEPEDANDIDQIVRVTAYENLETYKPWLSAYTSWLITITKRRVYNFFASQRTKPTQVSYDAIADYSADSSIIRVDYGRPDIGWSIPQICKEMMESGDHRRFRFAQMIMWAYIGESWVKPTSQEMADYVRVSRTTCHSWFGQLVSEAIKRESQS